MRRGEGKLNSKEEQRVNSGKREGGRGNEGSRARRKMRREQESKNGKEKSNEP